MSNPRNTGSARVTIALTLLLLVVAASALAGGGLANEQAQAATAPACTGVTLQPTVTKVQAGGLLELTGRICGQRSSIAGSGEVVIRLKRGTRWSVAGRARLTSAGDFTACTRINVPKRARSALLRAITSVGSSRTVRVKVRHGARAGCSAESSPAAATSPEVAPPATQPPAEPPPVDAPPPLSDPPTCPLSEAGSEIGYTVSPTCTTVLSDTASDPSPLDIWGAIECQNTNRHQLIGGGGDSGLTGNGAAQENDSFRRLTAYDGDNWWGERCELGRNDHRYGTTTAYHEGARRLTYLSLRLPDNFPLAVNTWQLVMQMKQTQPSNNGGGTPVIGLDASGNRWRLRQSESAGASSDTNELWSAPAKRNIWTRFAFDIVYSKSGELGSIRVYVDLNGDADFADPNEQSARMQTYTLKYETTTSSSFTAGASIPSHLRVGMYHNSSIACPSGCSVDVDNVQILAP